MSKQVDQRITITVDLDNIEAVLEFVEINLDALGEEEFRHIRKSVSAMYESVNIARRAQYEDDKTR